MPRSRKKPEIKQYNQEMQFVKSLGKGSYGSVDLVSYTKDDGSTFYNAVKISDSQCYDSLNKEFQILTKLKGCPKIIQCIGDTLFEDLNCHGNKVYKMVMEYAAAGTLTSFIERNRVLSDSIIRDFTRMILQGLASIHNHGYVHCDLKPENLLLFPKYDEETWNCSYELKISDFGLSIRDKDKSDCWKIDSPFVGTPIYMSPESVNDGLAVEKTLDLWSLGCIVLEMYAGKHPWLGFTIDYIKSLLLKGKAPNIPEIVPCAARQFMKKCFARKPKERGTALELLSHPFLVEYQNSGDGAAGGKRITKITTKKPLKLKVVSSKSSQFKKISNKHLKVKILPPRPSRRSNFVPVQ